MSENNRTQSTKDDELNSNLKSNKELKITLEQLKQFKIWGR